MSENHSGPRRFLEQARGLVQRFKNDKGSKETSNEEGELVEQLPSRTLLAPLTLGSRAARALMLKLEQPLQQMADSIAGQLLSLDEAAAQLALFIERAVDRFGQDAIISVVLRRNLMLDGTILAFIDPILKGQPPSGVRPEVLQKGRATLLSLLVEVTALDPEVEAPIGDLSPEEALAWLDEHGLEATFFALHEGLRGEGTPEEIAHFLTNSYMLFLQSFLMRAVVRIMGDLARGE